jgi:hypothetical protein
MSRKLDRKRVREAVQQHGSVVLKTTKYLAGERVSIDKVLEIFLEEAQLTEYKNKVAYCVHELASNAQKGNTKRAYFHEQGLNLHDPDQYRDGMASFKREAIGDPFRYVPLQRRLGLHVRLSFRLEGPEARISVSQNSGLTPEERARVQEKLDLARRTDALLNVYDSAHNADEGAGLGLVMTIIMLREIGLHDDVLETRFDPDETRFSLRLRRLDGERLQTA